MSQGLADSIIHPVGFDRQKYIDMQSAHIRERREKIGGKLYLEMGGKLFDDHHASRVLPGFTPDNKIVMLEQLKDQIEIVVCFNAKDIQRQKKRADLQITYEEDVLRLVDVFRERGFLVENVVMTQMEPDNQQAHQFSDRLERLGLKVAHHYTIPGYPSNTKLIVSEDGLGRNDYVETSRDLVVVTAPGPGSGSWPPACRRFITSLGAVFALAMRSLRRFRFGTFRWSIRSILPMRRRLRILRITTLLTRTTWRRMASR